MTSWPLVKLGEIAKIERKTVAPSEILSGTSYVGLENIAGDGGFRNVALSSNGELSSMKFRFNEKHVLYGKLRPYLTKIARPQFSGVCSTDILPILPGSEVNRDYLFHFLRQPEMIRIASSEDNRSESSSGQPGRVAQF